MSFPQLGYPQYLSAAGPGAYGGERPGVLAAAAAAAAAASSGRPGAAELGGGAGAAAVTSVLGMYAAAGPYAGAPNYSAFLPYAADLSLFSQMVSAPGLPRFSSVSPVPGQGWRVAREGETTGGPGPDEELERSEGRFQAAEAAAPGDARGRGGRAGDDWAISAWESGRPGPGGGSRESREAAEAGPGSAARAGGRGQTRLARPGRPGRPTGFLQLGPA